MGFYAVAVVRQHTQIHISHKITHHVQTKHRAQSYANNKRHITHNEYNTQKSKDVLVTGKYLVPNVMIIFWRTPKQEIAVQV
jgi:hypothetical protein